MAFGQQAVQGPSEDHSFADLTTQAGSQLAGASWAILSRKRELRTSPIAGLIMGRISRAVQPITSKRNAGAVMVSIGRGRRQFVAGGIE